MLFNTLASATLLAASASAHAFPRNTVRTCGAPRPTEQQLNATLAMLENERAGLVRPMAGFTVNTYFHVVAASTSVDDGYLTQTMIDDQLSVLNAAYAPHDISFSLQGTTFTINSGWADDSAELAMKKSLRQGSYSDLNIYFLRTPADQALGYCYFPDNVSEGSNDFYYDGCTIMAASVPGGSAAPYNLGGTVPHEVGHWMNLYHTFQDGCTGGDLVDDTPAEASAASGCPTGRDTCTAAGVDPIHNYMDYTDDACYEEFTAGQQARMYSAWSTYRS